MQATTFREPAVAKDASAAKAKVFAQVIPTRRPVYEPGPWSTQMRFKSRGDQPTEWHKSRIVGARDAVGRESAGSRADARI